MKYTVGTLQNNDCDFNSKRESLTGTNAKPVNWLNSKVQYYIQWITVIAFNVILNYYRVLQGKTVLKLRFLELKKLII